MKASDNMRYLESLGKCPSLFKVESSRIKAQRNRLMGNGTLSQDEKACYFDLLDSAAILVDMLIPLNYATSLMYRFRGVQLFNFNNTFVCEPIEAIDLYKFLRQQNEGDRKVILKKITHEEKLRNVLSLAIESNKPKQFISAFSKGSKDQNVLRGLFALNYGLNQSMQTFEGTEELDLSIETVVKHVFCVYQQMLLDLANFPPETDDSILTDVIISILKNVDFENEDVKTQISHIIKVRKRLSPISFRKICRYLTYISLMGYYMTFDQDLLLSPEREVIHQIIIRNQFNNYGNIIIRKCKQNIAAFESSDRIRQGFLRDNNRYRELWPVIENSKPFIDKTMEEDEQGRMQSEYFVSNKKNLYRQKLQQCINALAAWGYVDDDIQTKRVLYYRFSGYARPETLFKVEWHKEIEALFLLVKSILGKAKGKYSRMYEFFDVKGAEPNMIGHESAYAERVKDQSLRKLMKYLYGS